MSIQVTDTQTGEHLSVHQISRELARLDGVTLQRDPSALDQWVPITGPAPIDATIARPIPDPETDDLIQAALEGVTEWENLHHHASMYRDHAVQIMHDSSERERLTVRDVTTPLYEAYERERDALITGLRSREYGGHVYDQAQGFVEAGPPHRLPPPPPPPPPPPEQQRQRAETLAPLAERQVQTGSGAEVEPDGWVRSTWLTRALAWLGGRKRGL